MPFYKTSTFHEAKHFLKSGGKILCLIGRWGSGKSTTAKQVFSSLTGRKPIVIEDILKFDVSSCQESVIVEEPTEDIYDLEKSNVVEKVISLCKQIRNTNNSFLIITSTDEAWKTFAEAIKDCLFQNNDLCCLDVNWKSLTDADRIQILHTIFEFYNQDTPFSNVEQAVSKIKTHSFGFPEICTFLSRCKEFQNILVLFLNRPLRSLSSHLEKMCQSSEGKEKFPLLVFMSMNDMKIDMNKLNEKLREIFKSCGLNVDNNVQLQALIPEEFVLKVESSVYVLRHDLIKRITLITFGKFYFSDLLRFFSKKDFVGWIKHKKKNILTPLMEGTNASDIEPFLEINDEQWTEYQEKMRSTPRLSCEKSDKINTKNEDI